MEEIDFESDSFADIVEKDDRYDSRAYALLADCLKYLGEDRKMEHMSATDILDDFRERALDQYGPLAFRVLAEWGVHRTEDVGEMMGNLCESHRIAADENDTPEGFVAGYDFEEAFLGPYTT